MAEEPTAVTDNKPKVPSNGADKTPWTQTPAGRKTLSENAKAAHAAKRRSTKAVPEEKINRLLALIKGGSTVKEASQLIGMGYSTAQRYAQVKGAAAKKSSRAKVKKAKGLHSRLAPEKVKLLIRLLPKLGSKLTATDIAKRVGCHMTSVYFYRKKMLAEAGSPAVAVRGVQASGIGGSQLSLTDYADLKDVYETLWHDCFMDDVEPTNAEIRFTRVWRRIRSRTQT